MAPSLSLTVSHSNIAQLSSKYCATVIQILCNYHPNIVQLPSKYCAIVIWILCSCHPNIVQLSSKHCANVIKTLCNCHRNIVQFVSKYAMTLWILCNGHLFKVEEYVSCLEKLTTDMRFTLYNILYKRILVIWIFSAFMVLIGILFR